MARSLRIAGRGIAAASLLGCGIWGVLFLWFGSPGGVWIGGPAAAAFGAATLAALGALWLRSWPWLGAWSAAFAGLLVWFFALVPRGDRDWDPDVARPVTAAISGSQVTIENVRAFEWRTETAFTERWETRLFDMAGLRTLDLINSYWAGPVIAHTLFSFGFDDGRYLAFSVEIRREKGEDYSSIAGFFRQYEMIVLAADERDVVRLRTNVRGEDAQLYRMRAEPDQVRAVFSALLRRANAVARDPVWYNSLTRNCTTELFGAVHEVLPDLPFDWRLVLSGYLPEYAYDVRRVDTRLSFRDLRERSRIGERGKAADSAPDFSRRIRDLIPDPNGSG